MKINIQAFAKTAITELIFNKWSLMFLLYAIPALIIGQEAVKTARAVNWTPAEVSVTSSQFEANEPSVREYVKAEVEKAGLSWKEVNCLIEHESGWNEWAQGVNTNLTTDSGIWMINSVHKGTIALKDRIDIKKATAWAIEKRLHDGNWSAWYGFSNCK